MRVKGVMTSEERLKKEGEAWLNEQVTNSESMASVHRSNQDFKVQVISLLRENQILKERLLVLESRLATAEDEKAIVKTVSSVLADTSDTFKNKIYQDRQFYDSLCDKKDRDYQRLLRDHQDLVNEHKQLCEKYSDLEISKGRSESEAALKHADDLRVRETEADHKPFELSVEGLQGRQYCPSKGA